MRFRKRYRSRNVVDRRFSGGGGLSGFPIGAAGGGIGGVIVLLIVLFLSGALGGGGSSPDEAGPPAEDPEAELVSFVSFVFDDAQRTWTALFEASGQTYRPTEMVLFRDATDTGCGYATSEVGPFYCPADERVYLDLGFFRELRDRYGAEGDFAQAYVIAHEVGHHVQHQLGIDDRVRRISGGDRSRANELSVRQELQADCFAGVWGKSTRERGLLETGDLREGLGAAAAVGDDRIQREATGEVNPETWTHGSATQRRSWFERGFRTGDADDCDTFGWN